MARRKAGSSLKLQVFYPISGKKSGFWRPQAAFSAAYDTLASTRVACPNSTGRRRRDKRGFMSAKGSLLASVVLGTALAAGGVRAEEKTSPPLVVVSGEAVLRAAP